jgi:hypothetical protein
MFGTSTSIKALCAALLLVGFSAGSAVAAAPCQQWDAGGKWIALQGPFEIWFHLNQDGRNIIGQAQFGRSSGLTSADMDPNAPGYGNGEVDGFVDGSSIEMTTYWSSNSIGKYVGTIGPTGRIEGFTFDKRNPVSKAQWHSKTRLDCLDSASASATPPPPAKKSKVLGKKKPAFDPKKSSVEETGPIAATVPASGCKPGFVERLTRPEDNVCVSPEARARIQQENDEAEFYIDPNGAYGPNSCMAGYVWRDAYNGDGVCVTPVARETAKDENRAASSNRIGG